MMIQIREIKDKPAKLYQGDSFIGEIDSLLVLNDVRIQIKNEQLQDCYLIFEGIKIDIDKNGGLNHWPEDFFDTFEKQIHTLLGWI